MSTDLKAAHGIVLTYSIADKSSFDYVEKMVQEIGGKNQKEVGHTLDSLLLFLF